MGRINLIYSRALVFKGRGEFLFKRGYRMFSLFLLFGAWFLCFCPRNLDVFYFDVFICLSSSFGKMDGLGFG